jgi:hypothetical protein
MSTLRERVAEAVQARRARKAKTRTKQKYLKMSRKQLEDFLEQERRLKLGASITRFAIDADASDEERAAIKREAVIENIQRVNKRGDVKRKAQRKRKLKKLKIEAEHELAHIDEFLKCESGSKVKMRRKERHQMAAMIGKARKKEANSERSAKQIEARKWEKSGKSTMGRWINSGISERDDRKEKPDRDKDDS